jgi:hypothetical protein
VISALEANCFASFEASPLLRGRLVLVLDENRTAEIKQGKAHFRLTYDPHKGLVHERG